LPVRKVHFFGPAVLQAAEPLEVPPVSLATGERSGVHFDERRILMKRILASTAIALIMAGGTVAGTGFAAEIGMYQAQPTDMRASQLIGQSIYATDTTPAETVQVGAEKDWDDVGDINEVILGRDGTVKAVVLGVGGFLGIGEKNVAIDLKDVKFVKNGDAPDDYFLVVNANKDTLTAAPAFVTPEDKQEAAADAQTANDTAAVTSGAATTDGTAMTDDTASAPAATATDTANNTTAMEPAASTDTTTTASTNAADRTMLTRPDITRDGYAMAKPEEITAEKLQGARVYGPNDEDVGEINRLVLSSDGKSIDRVVLDIGGFLGMGERQIAVTMDELNIVRSADGSDFRVYVDANQANLKAQPEYKG
jgi:sporulation protein YlmC with PRC-barrel domain